MELLTRSLALTALRGLAIALAWASVACAPRPTELIVELCPEVRSGRSDATVEVEAEVGGVTRSITLSAADLDTPAPITIALARTTANATSATVRVRASAEGRVLLEGTVEANFVPGETRVLVIPLARACVGVACGAGVCLAGECVASLRPTTPWTGQSACNATVGDAGPRPDDSGAADALRADTSSLDTASLDTAVALDVFVPGVDASSDTFRPMDTGSDAFRMPDAGSDTFRPVDAGTDTRTDAAGCRCATGSCRDGECVVAGGCEAGCEEGFTCLAGDCVCTSPTCAAACSTASDCGSSMSCEGGRCLPKRSECYPNLPWPCPAQCAEVGGAFACEAGSLSEGAECARDRECQAGLVCESDQCTRLCRRSRDCIGGALCSDVDGDWRGGGCLSVSSTCSTCDGVCISGRGCVTLDCACGFGRTCTYERSPAPGLPWCSAAAPRCSTGVHLGGRTCTRGLPCVIGWGDPCPAGQTCTSLTELPGTWPAPRRPARDGLCTFNTVL